ncbi:MAK10-like protein [Tanacetum coccineum]
MIISFLFLFRSLQKSTQEHSVKEVDETNEVDDKLAKSVKENVMKNEEEEPEGVFRSHVVGYYLKHRINEKLIEGLVENHRFNDSLSATRVGKMKRKTYNLLPKGPVYEAIPKKKITRKEDIGGNFEIPCNIGGLKHMNALVDQGSNVNVMPLSTYKKLTDERPDALVDVDGYVYPVDFVILDIKEDEKRPFILGTPFLTTTKAVIKFDKGIVTLRSGKSKMSFHRIPESICKIEKGIKNDIKPIAPTMTMNRLVIFDEKKLGRNARVWFDDLPSESIDSYDNLKKAFLENYLQQKKCIKDPIELHNIKQQDGESTEDFVRRYKLERRDVKGAP